MRKLYLIDPGPRPFFGALVDHLWGPGCDFDSDGNDDPALAGGWTELTVTLRSNDAQRVDIDPLDDDAPLVLVIRSEKPELAHAAASYLQSGTGGTVRNAPPGGRG